MQGTKVKIRFAGESMEEKYQLTGVQEQKKERGENKFKSVHMVTVHSFTGTFERKFALA